ncbi:MAG TPA: hypothetical protein DCL66_08140 [Gammaproteobacteria bacterium]|nr:hypothetical protein [Gammaproteobacteria bacterium]
MNYLNDREAGVHFGFRRRLVIILGGKIRAVAKTVRMALAAEVPVRASKSEFMGNDGGARDAQGGIFLGHSEVRKREFSCSIIYTAEGYLSQ